MWYIASPHLSLHKCGPLERKQGTYKYKLVLLVEKTVQWVMDSFVLPWSLFYTQTALEINVHPSCSCYDNVHSGISMYSPALYIVIHQGTSQQIIKKWGQADFLISSKILKTKRSRCKCKLSGTLLSCLITPRESPGQISQLASPDLLADAAVELQWFIWLGETGSSCEHWTPPTPLSGVAHI